MKLLTEKAVITCVHNGPVGPKTHQGFVRIEGSLVLVHPDTADRPVVCPEPPQSPTMCKKTLAPPTVSSGRSNLLFIDGHQVLRDDLTGTTMSGFKYKVGEAGGMKMAGNTFVEEA